MKKAIGFLLVLSLSIPAVLADKVSGYIFTTLDVPDSTMTQAVDINNFGQSVLQNAKKACHECRFGESPKCMSTSCCEMATSDPDVFEEYVCCAGVGFFVDRICTFPNDPDNPCGQAGSAGCAVCWYAPYENYCIAYEDPDDPSACAYDFK